MLIHCDLFRLNQKYIQPLIPYAEKYYETNIKAKKKGGLQIMKNYGLQRSAVEPKAVEITESKVFIATDIEQVTLTMDEQETQEYQFNLVEYEKDEYIEIISEKNEELEQQMTDTQLALCDVYEMINQ